MTDRKNSERFDQTEDISIHDIDAYKKQQDMLKKIINFILEVAICCSILLMCSNFICKPVRVSGSSMYPTLVDNEVGIVNIIGKKISGLKRFDVVIIHVENKYIIKRVIGLPGETIAYLNGQLYINEEPVSEDFLDTKYKQDYDGTFMEDVSPVRLRDDEYYCLGDNRPNSADSRVYGPFKNDQIIAKSFVVLLKKK